MTFAPPLTIGVVTYERSDMLATLLERLKACVDAYSGNCELLIANNSGAPYHAQLMGIIQASGLQNHCTVSVEDSTVNDISVGRNLILNSAKTRFIIFTDDDIEPVREWIPSLMNQLQASNAAVVAGPIHTLFADSVTGWVKEIDLHNIGTNKTGDVMRHVPTGNLLLDMDVVKELRFDETFGKTGGEDTFFIEKLLRQGVKIVWSEEAAVTETFEEHKSHWRYMFFRFMHQGQNFRRIVLHEKTGLPVVIFYLKALVVAPTCIALGTVMIPLSNKGAAKWLKRGFTNLGKFIKIGKALHG